MTWLPDADGCWGVVGSGSSAPALPGAADDGALDVGGATARSITRRSGGAVLDNLLSEDNFVLQGGTLTLNGASTVNGSYTPQGDTLSGTGCLTINGEVR